MLIFFFVKSQILLSFKFERTTVLDETRGQVSRLLSPAFSLAAQLRDSSYSLVCMEGNIAADKGLSQI